MGRLCGLVAPDGAKAYFFFEERYVRYDIALDRVDDGYPLRIADQWPGLWASDVDAVVSWDEQNTYFFRGGEVCRYDLSAGVDRVVDAPRPIGDLFPGLFPGGVDAAIRWGSGRVYFFSGPDYQTYDEGKISDPEPIADGWAGAFDRVGTALWWPDGTPYLLSGELFLQVDQETGAAVGEPGAIADRWPGLLPVPPLTRTVRAVFPGFSAEFEGRLPYLYQDINGQVTTGVGNLVDTPGEVVGLPWFNVHTGQPAGREEIEAEWHRIKTAPGLARGGHLEAKKIRTLELPQSAVDELVRTRFDANEARLARFFPGWADWPADARLGAHSIAWTGSMFPTGWPNFTAAANAGDWLAAAAHAHIQDHDNPGVRPRNAANLRLFHNAAAVLARGLDPHTLFYPDAL